jgi:hypothetical protein
MPKCCSMWSSLSSIPAHRTTTHNGVSSSRQPPKWGGGHTCNEEGAAVRGSRGCSLQLLQPIEWAVQVLDARRFDLQLARYLLRVDTRAPTCRGVGVEGGGGGQSLVGEGGGGTSCCLPCLLTNAQAELLLVAVTVALLLRGSQGFDSARQLE